MTLLTVQFLPDPRPVQFTCTAHRGAVIDRRILLAGRPICEPCYQAEAAARQFECGECQALSDDAEDLNASGLCLTCSAGGEAAR